MVPNVDYAGINFGRLSRVTGTLDSVSDNHLASFLLWFHRGGLFGL
jgi:hypothetical protein